MNMRALVVGVLLLLVFRPAMAAGQTPDASNPELDRVSVQVAAGPLWKSGGYTLSTAVGFSPISRLDLVVSIERNHLPFQRDTFSDGYSLTRGGTMTAVSGEVRFSLMPPHRVSPYGFAGMGGGTSRPTVNDAFPTPVENQLRVVYFGGGLRVPLRGGLSVFGDARLMLAMEGADGFSGVWPVRAGLAWRF